MLRLVGIRKEIQFKKKESLIVLNELDLEVSKKKSIAIKGRSGSGKTTLLKILLGLDTKYTGGCMINSHHLDLMNTAELSEFRQKNLAVITQRFDLLDDRNVYENIVLAITHQKLSTKERKRRVTEVLSYVNLEGYERKSVKELSGGEMQRIGIARALIKETDLIIADEPTGSLDEETRNEILYLFKKLISDGKQFIIVTHDEEVADICDDVYCLKNGKLTQISG